jgi:hypothetical protein
MGVDPLADERSWMTPYNYVQNNPITRIDPTGALDHEYDVVTNKDGSTTTTKTGNKGGDEVDIITYKDSEGNVTGGESVMVQNTYSSGIDTRHTQDSDPTPGKRNIHGSMPLDVKVYLTALNFYSGGGVSSTLGFAKIPCLEFLKEKFGLMY